MKKRKKQKMSLKDLRRLRVTIKKAFEVAACIAVASTALNRVASSRAKQIFEPGGYVPGTANWQ